MKSCGGAAVDCTSVFGHVGQSGISIGRQSSCWHHVTNKCEGLNTLISNSRVKVWKGRKFNLCCLYKLIILIIYLYFFSPSFGPPGLCEWLQTQVTYRRWCLPAVYCLNKVGGEENACELICRGASALIVQYFVYTMYMSYWPLAAVTQKCHSSWDK